MIRILITILSIVPLLAIGLFAVAVPARHGLLPLWPAPLVEVVHTGESGGVNREVFEPLRTPASGLWLLRRGDPSREIVQIERDRIESHDRPLSAVVVEDLSGGRFFGYLIGVREEADGELLENSTAWIGADSAHYAGDPPPLIFVLQSSGGEHIEFAPTQLLRYYRPNRMGRAGKFRLFLARLRALGLESEILSETDT